MANQTFKVAGITVHNGDAKVRFTDDMIRRIKQFNKGGATRCDFVELPTEMTKVDAVKYLQTLPQFASAEDQATLAECLADREKDLRKGQVKVKVAKVKTSAKKGAKAKPSLDSIKARAKKAQVEITSDSSSQEEVSQDQSDQEPMMS